MSWIISVKRWQWLVIAMIFGGLAGYAWRLNIADPHRLGEQLNDQATFERAMLNTEHRMDRPWFQDVHAYLGQLDDGAGGTRPACVIWGMFYNGMPDWNDHQWRLRPTFFTADVPYKPTIKPGQGAWTDDAARQFARLASPTALDFLSTLRASGPVSFTHLWWHTWCMATCLISSVLLIGLVLPTAIDLTYYGRWIRPREEKGISLSDAVAAPANANVGPSAEDLQKLEQLDAALEAGLAAATTAPRPPAKPPAPQIRKLNTTPIAAAAAIQNKTHKAFKAGEKDFYPTELKERPPHEQ